MMGNDFENPWGQKTPKGNLVRNHIFRDGSIGRTLICPPNENHKSQILINSKFESTSCEDEISNICDPFVTEVLDFDLDLSTKTETYYVRCKWIIWISTIWRFLFAYPIIQFQVSKPHNYGELGILPRLKGSTEWNSIFLWQRRDLVTSTNCRKNLFHFSNHWALDRKVVWRV